MIADVVKDIPYVALHLAFAVVVAVVVVVGKIRWAFIRKALVTHYYIDLNVRKDSISSKQLMPFLKETI
jgi:hypothetical protein